MLGARPDSRQPPAAGSGRPGRDRLAAWPVEPDGSPSVANWT
jgi:hypothetical protein